MSATRQYSDARNRTDPMVKQQRDDELTMDGVVLEALSNAMFSVQITPNHVVIAYVSGKMRKNHIKFLPGDQVQVVLSAYDLTRGRITYRNPTS